MATMLLSSLCFILWMKYAQLNSVYGYTGECYNVSTSEGVRTLQHQQTACTPLDRGDIGVRYLICIYGDVSVKECPSSLRYDTISKGCIDPERSSCQLEQHNRTCSTHNCKLPNCFCYGSRPDIHVRDTPQFVMVTFDDSVTKFQYEVYFKNVFVHNAHQIFNPSGCPLRAAFFLSTVATEFSSVKRLWEAGHEIASHTVHHRLPNGVSAYDYEDASSENYEAYYFSVMLKMGKILLEINMSKKIVGVRQKLLKALKNKTVVDTVVGFRSPYLRVAHNIQFDVLRDFHFLYDSSFVIPRTPDKPPLWPFTLDFQFAGRCDLDPCPTKVYPGLWEIMLNDWQREDGHACSMVNRCIKKDQVKTASQKEWSSVFRNNFAYFYKHKVPMPFFTHATMFQRSHASFPAMTNWLKRLTASHSDVWLVTPQQVLQWMKKPMTNEQMKAHRWGC